MKKLLVSMFVVGGVGLITGLSAAWALDVSNAACPISGKAVKEQASVDYRGGQLYFCCNNCPKAFAGNTAKFATKANHQLAATGQAQQGKCPISGKAVKENTALDVGGVSVTFCCNGCRKKVDGAEGDQQLDLVFGDKAFDKAFTVGSE
jgi:YHS domain-containing protein